MRGALGLFSFSVLASLRRRNMPALHGLNSGSGLRAPSTTCMSGRVRNGINQFGIQKLCRPGEGLNENGNQRRCESGHWSRQGRSTSASPITVQAGGPENQRQISRSQGRADVSRVSCVPICTACLQLMVCMNPTTRRDILSTLTRLSCKEATEEKLLMRTLFIVF